MATVPATYLSPAGRAAIAARAKALHDYLAARRAEREMLAALGKVRESSRGAA